MSFILLLPSVALADPDNPDNLQIVDVQCFRHLIEQNDFLAIVLFDIEYETPPDEVANTYFLFRLMDPSEDEIGQQVPFSYGMDGYQYGITGFYFSPENAPAWGGTHSVRLEGNPLEWDTLPTPSVWAIATEDYSTGATQIDNQDELELWIYSAIQDVETDWDVPGELATSTASGIVLLIAGQYYLTGAIPGLNYMAPDIFIMTDAYIEYPEDTQWSEDREDNTELLYDGTQIEGFKELCSEIMGGINSTVASSIVVFIGILGLMILSFGKWQTTEWGYQVAPPILYYGARLTFIPWVVFGLACFLAIAYVLWMKFGKFG